LSVPQKRLTNSAVGPECRPIRFIAGGTSWHGSLAAEETYRPTPTAVSRWATGPPLTQADIAHRANQPPAGNERPVALLPNIVELLQERIVVGDMPKLSCAAALLIERPIGRRRQHQTNRLRRQLHPPRITDGYPVRRRNTTHGQCNVLDEPRVHCTCRQRRLSVFERREAVGQIGVVGFGGIQEHRVSLRVPNRMQRKPSDIGAPDFWIYIADRQ
jgi:hypothetical protein